MASIPQQAAAAAPALQAAHAAPSCSAAYARHHPLAARGDAASPAAARGPRHGSGAGYARPSRAAPYSADHVQASSHYTSTSHMRVQRHSNHGEYASSSSNGDGAASAMPQPGFVPLSRHHSIHSQPLAGKTPGTPGLRSRMLIGSNAVMRPLPTPSSTLSMSSAPTTSPTRSSYSAAAATAAAALPADDVLCRILGSCLPTVFEALAKYQYQQATSVLVKFGEELASDPTASGDVRLEWRNWDAFAVMVRLAAACESSYHLMRYLEPDMLHTETLDQMYHKLGVLLHHLLDDIQPVLQRARQRSGRPERTASPPGSGGVRSVTSEEALESELNRLMVDDLEYYYGLLDQAAQFFSLRVSMIGLYRGLATQTPPHKYAGMAKTLERLMKRHAQFEHPLLATLKQSTVEELRTVKAAFDSEIWMAQYDFTKSMVALHRFKASLRMWSDHIDSVSEYPLFDESGDDDDDDDYLLSGSTYSNNNSVGSLTLQMQQHAASALLFDSQYTGSDVVAAPPTGSLPRPHRESSFNRRSGNQSLTTTTDMLALAAAAEQAATAGNPATPNAKDAQNAFSRLRGSLLKRGLSVASLRSRIQAATSVLPPTPPTNALEHAILGSTPSVVNGGLASSMLTPVGNGLSSVGAGGASGFNTTNAHTLAAEMMASAVAKQEREDGYALPVYQWSKRFYRSLVAKFTLYFHRWLEPFERRGDALSPFDLTRFIRSPVGISYLQLIDVLLAKGSHRAEDGVASVMLIVETDKLDNKGAKFYANGYLCPGSSHREVAKQPQVDSSAKGSSSKRPASSSKSLSRSASSDSGYGMAALMRPPPSTGATTVTLSSSSDSSSSQSHSLFNLNFDPEPEDEENGDFAPLWGLRGWPAVFCYPQQEPPLQHWPNIVSLIMDNRHVLEVQAGRGPFVHTERRLKASYYITSVDPAVFLVLLLEGKRRPSEKTTQDFMQTMAENLQHSGVYRRGGMASSR